MTLPFEIHLGAYNGECLGQIPHCHVVPTTIACVNSDLACCNECPHGAAPY